MENSNSTIYSNSKHDYSTATTYNPYGLYCAICLSDERFERRHCDYFI